MGRKTTLYNQRSKPGPVRDATDAGFLVIGRGNSILVSIALGSDGKLSFLRLRLGSIDNMTMVIVILGRGNYTFNVVSSRGVGECR